MKLKKFAAMMLAGVMAVSMLAGCNNISNNGGNGGAGEGEGEGNVTTSGYSAIMAKAVNEAVKDMDYVTFKDNADDEAALKTSLNYLSSNVIANVQNNQNVPTIIEPEIWGDNWAAMAASLQDDLKMSNENMNLEDFTYYTEHNVWINNDVKAGVVYAVNGAVGFDEAVKLVASYVTDELEDLVDEDEAAGELWKYEYVVSASVANKTVGDHSANFVLVTVDRTVTNA